MEVLADDLRAAGHADLAAPLDAALPPRLDGPSPPPPAASAAAAASLPDLLLAALPSLILQAAAIDRTAAPAAAAGAGAAFSKRLRKAWAFCIGVDNGRAYLRYELTRDGSDYFVPFASCLALRRSHDELYLDRLLPPRTAEGGRRTYVLWDTRGSRDGGALSPRRGPAATRPLPCFCAPLIPAPRL